MSSPPVPLLGVILAGGESRRFGRDKATAHVAGQPMALRVGRTLAPWVARIGVVANAPEVARALEWPCRPDARSGLGPAGGVLTGLAWARELEMAGALVVACDLPLVPGALLGLLAGRFTGGRPVAPASPGRLGVEPLCAVYPAASLETVEEVLADGPLPAHRLLARLSPEIISLEEVETACDPGQAFLNVNRALDRDRAEAILSGSPE